MLSELRASLGGQTQPSGSARTGLNTNTLATGSNPPEIVELARALKYDPDLIYEYLHNNIEYSPLFIMQKGPVGTLLDGRGTVFDIDSLFVALLQESGLHNNTIGAITYEMGEIHLDGPTVMNLLGVDDNAYSLGAVMGAAGLAGTPFRGPNNTIAYAEYSHLWVKVNLGGTDYVFDPAFRSFNRKAHIDLAQAMGYSRPTFISDVETGATITPTSIQGLNRSKLRSDLQAFSSNLVSFIRANAPAASVADIVGGEEVIPIRSSVRQTTLPYLKPGTTVTDFTEIPSNFRTAITISIPGMTPTSITYYSDAVYGHRLAAFFNASHQPVLTLDGNIQGTGSAVAANSYYQLGIQVQVPTAPFANQTDPRAVSTDVPVAIYTAVGEVGRGTIERYRRQLQQAVNSGETAASEPVLGTSLAIIGYTHAAEEAQTLKLSSNIFSTVFGSYHEVGVVGFAIGSTTGLRSPYIDIATNGAAPIRASRINGSSGPNDPTNAGSAYWATSDFGSALESGVLEQTQFGVTNFAASSTVKVVDLATTTDTILDINDGNTAASRAAYNTTQRGQLINYNSATVSRLDTLVNTQGFRVIAPVHGDYTIGTAPWKGVGYLAYPQTDAQFQQYGIGAYYIDGYLNGGYGGTPESFSAFTGSTGTAQPPATNAPSTSLFDWVVNGANIGLRAVGDPVDRVSGSFLYSHDDLTIGTGSFPYTLGFQRIYSSGVNQSGVLGKGWTHNFAMSTVVNGDAFDAMGEASATAAASAIVGLFVSGDLTNNLTSFYDLPPVDLQVMQFMTSQWTVDQFLSNVVIVTTPEGAEHFVRLADGTFAPPLGSAAAITPNGDGSFTYVTKDKTTLKFNTAGSITSWTNAAGVVVNFTYTNGQLASVQNNLGRQLVFTYSGSQLISVADGTGRTVSYGYANGNLTSAVNPVGHQTIFAYDTSGMLDTAGHLTQVFDPSNPSNPFITNTYDSLGRVSRQQDANGNLTQFFIAGARTEVVNPLGNRRVWINDARGNVLQFIQDFGDNTHLNISTVFSYDGQNRLASQTLPEGLTTSYTYSTDFLQNLTQLTVTAKSGSPLSALTTTYSYDPIYNKPTRVTDPLGLVMTMSYDPATGNLVQQVRDAGASPHFNSTTGFTYDAHGLLLSTTDPLNVVTRYGYDSFGNLLTTIRDAGRLNIVEKRTYDAVGNQLTATNPNGNVTASTYDPDRRLTGVTVPAAAGSPPLTTTTSYDPNGNPTQIQQSASGTTLRASSRTYTKTNKVATATDGNGNITRYAYDVGDRLSRVTDPVGRVTTYGYDALDRQFTTSNPAIQSAPLVTTQFSPDGLVASLTDANGNVLSYTYDGLDRLWTTTYPATSGMGATTETLTYDADSNIKTRMTRKGDTISYGYDTLNRLTTKTEPSGTPSVTYSYDQNGRLLTVGDNSPSLVGASPSLNFAVNATYDARNRPISMNWDSVSAQSTPASAASVTFTHQYDASNRRVRQAANDNSWLSYPPGPTGTTVYSANALNQYGQVGTVTPTYDANGNLTFDGTFAYGYDAESRLVSIAQGGISVATYAYDGRGRRKSRTAGGNTTVYVTGAEDQELFEYNGTSGAPTAVYAVNLGGGLDEVLNRATPGGTRQTLVPDIQGSIVAALDSGGTLTKIGYQPFGESASAVTSGAGPRYTGRRLDTETATGSAQPSGLYYYRARTYSPTLGRFLQADPIGPAGGVNLYAYVQNDPLNLTDPLGLCDNPQGCGSGFSNYVSGSLSALGQIPSDIGNLLNNPSQIPGALSSALPGIAPAAGELPSTASGLASVIRLLGGSGGSDGVPPNSFTGNSQNQYQAPEGVPPRNDPGTIGNTPISGHALDQAQNRGIPYSVIEQALRTGEVTPDLPGTVRIYDPVNRITLFQNSNTGNIITLRMGR